jgi:hypothetical protein
MSGGLDEIVGLQPAELLRRGGGYVLGEEQSTGDVEVLLHAVGIDLQTFGYLAHRCHSPADEDWPEQFSGHSSNSKNAV